MSLFYILGGIMIAALLACVLYQRHSQKLLLRRMGKMLEDAGNGHFQPELIDESMLSSIENSMKRFLTDSILSEENLQEQNGRIQTLISDISHQTVTPLSNIMIYSQLLEEEMAGNPQEEKVRAIRKQGEKLDFLLQSLVKTSRLETGIIKTQAAECDLCGLMESVCEQGRQKAEDKGIDLIFVRGEPQQVAFCDPKWTREACFNILDNAIKYTAEGGRIEVSITAYQLFARIDIKDNGSGMEEEEIPKIFGRFYRGSQAAEKDGVGLGLYLTRQIIESEGGYIKVTSKPGLGSCFSVFVPELKGNISKV